MEDTELKELASLFHKMKHVHLHEHNRAEHCGYMYFVIESLDTVIRDLIKEIANHNNMADFFWVQISYDEKKGMLYRIAVPLGKGQVLKQKLEKIIANEEEWVDWNRMSEYENN